MISNPQSIFAFSALTSAFFAINQNNITPSGFLGCLRSMLLDNIPSSFVGELLYIYDVHGKRLSKMVINGTQMSMECYGLPCGVYFIQTSDGKWSSKFVIE